MSVYFISNGQGLVKIGRSKDVQKRLKSLQTGSPHPLEIIRTFEGEGGAELWFHKEFEERRVHGEWFRFCDDMLVAVPLENQRGQPVIKFDTAIEFIRRYVFRCSQCEFSLIAGVAQPTVSRWETGKSLPYLKEMQAIRTEAQKRGLEWSDAWFFEPAKSMEATQ